jgi:hypothetical protein
MSSQEQSIELSAAQEALLGEIYEDSKFETDLIGYPYLQVDVVIDRSIGNFHSPDEMEVIRQAAYGLIAKREGGGKPRKYFDHPDTPRPLFAHKLHFTEVTKPRPVGTNYPGKVTPIIFHYALNEGEPFAKQAVIESEIKAEPEQHFEVCMAALGNDPRIDGAVHFGIGFELRFVPRIFAVLQVLIHHLEPEKQQALRFTWQQAMQAIEERAIYAKANHWADYDIANFKELAYNKEQVAKDSDG